MEFKSLTTYFKDLDGSVSQRKTHMDHSKIYEGKIQTYSDLLNLLRHVITISVAGYLVTSKMLILILTSLKKCVSTRSFAGASTKGARSSR